MKKTNKNNIKILIFTTLMLFIIAQSDSSNTEISEITTLEIDRPIEVKTSGYWTNFTYIHILGTNWSIAEQYDWCPGSGTIGDPYRIENMVIDASTSPNGCGIWIQNSNNYYFEIKNCTVYGAYDYSVNNEGGIRLTNARNGTLIGNNCSNNNNVPGIVIEGTGYNKIIGGTVNNQPGIYGIWLANTKWNTISNVKIDNNQFGIYLSGAQYNYIYNNTISNSGVDGIRNFNTGSSPHNQFIENTIFNSTENGIYINGYNATVFNNTLYDNYWGIHVYQGWSAHVYENHLNHNQVGVQLYLPLTQDNIVENNDINGSTSNGIMIFNTAHDNIVRDNNITNTDGYGIQFRENVYRNTVENNNIDTILSGTADCMYMWWYSHSNIIRNNTLNNCPDKGIFVATGCYNNTFEKNVITNVGSIGIHSEFSGAQPNYNNTFDDNNITAIAAGIRLDTVRDDIVKNNRIIGCGSDGIILESTCNDTKIIDNFIFDNTNQGITLLDGCENNTINGNTIANHTAGILVSLGTLGNLFYNNSFINNTNHVLDNASPGPNYWNTTGIGNYWDDYTGNDYDDNGIGEEPYDVPSGFYDAKDHHPIWSDGVGGKGIYIDGTATGVGAHNWTWAESQVWCTGSGTFGDPYLIQGNTFDGKYTNSSINIENSNVYFTIEGCNLINSAVWPDAGILLYNVQNGTIKDNFVYNNLGHGMYIRSGSVNITIIGNSVYNNSNGIHLSGNSNFNRIEDNDIFNQTASGIVLYSNCINNTIQMNNITNSVASGVFIQNICHNNTVENNNITLNGADGVCIDQNSIDNNIIDNNILENDNGIYIEDGNRTKVWLNLIENNTNYGVSIDIDGNYSLIYNNIFTTNGQNANDDGNNNIWYSGTTGNVWDDYIGKDENDNNRGDTPYDIPGSAGSQDIYPIFSDGDETPEKPGNGKTTPPPDNSIIIIIIGVLIGVGAVMGIAFFMRNKQKGRID